MRSLVEAQTPTVPKGLPTDPTRIRLLARVDAKVSCQRPRVAKTGIADTAGIRPFTCVDALVDLQVLHAVKVSAAEGAVVRATAWWEQALLGAADVVLTMPAQLLRQAKVLAAHLAHMLASRRRGILLRLACAGCWGRHRVPVWVGFGERP